MQLTPSQEDALNIKRHVCVTAGAGSGKTTVLVNRYLKILRKGNVKTPREIVAITFTEKAAAEMRERVTKELSGQEGNNGAESNNSLRHFREEMNSAHISTIHAFCSRILREFPFQADVPANFSIIQGIDQKLLLQKTIKKTLKDIATNEDDEHRSELARLLRCYPGDRQRLEELFSNMINHRDAIERIIERVYNNQCRTQLPNVWEPVIQAESLLENDVVEFIRCLNTVLQVAKGKNKETVEDLTRKLEALPERNPNLPKVLKLLKEIAVPITTGTNTIAKRDFLGNRVGTTGIETETDFLVSAAKKIKSAPLLDEGEETDDEFLLGATHDLLTLYTRILNAYETDKLSQGKLDQSDLQLKVRDLLRNNEEIRQKLVNRHKYYMIDEYQDTNELQYELVMLLTNELKSANLFIVGDPKQSIYGFRDADIRVFRKTEEKIVNEGGVTISLKENFRSLRDPVGFVNYFFNHLMGDGSENEFEVPYQALTQARNVDADSRVEILLGKQGDAPVEESKLIARHIKTMRVNEDTVSVRDKNGKEVERPIQYGDVAILIRYRSHLPNIEHALLEEGIPYLTTGGIGFYQRQEIYDIWNYLNFLNTPLGKHPSIVGILRSPAFGISDTELYEISLQEGTNFWEKVQSYQAGTGYLCRAVAILKRHCQIAHRMSVNQLIQTIVNETGMIGTLKTGKYGEQRWANYQKLLELARNFDGDENTQILPDFIEFLDTLITEEPREGQASIEASDAAVQIMTVHAAKGLQFPVVVLPCLERGGQSPREPFIDDAFGIGFSPLKPEKNYRKTAPRIVPHMKNRLVEKGNAEKKRLFYVGATRACDKLILSGTLSKQEMLGWLHEHLGIVEEDNLLNLPVVLDVFADDGTNSASFELQIPIRRELADSVSADEMSEATKPVDFPELLSQTPELTDVPAAFSVDELANYARCPLRYQLQNVLRIPVNGQKEAEADETEMAAAVRSAFARLRQRPDAEKLDTLIEQVSENYPEITGESKTLISEYVNNFLNSGLGEIAFEAADTDYNQQIHANIKGHIINGRLDRLFKDETGNWQVINYKTGDLQSLDTCRPEVELYSLLMHRHYPNQSNLTINFFFTEHNRCEQMHFNASELQEVQEQWQRKILALQGGVYDKNLEHCCSCPYADSDGECIITET